MEDALFHQRWSGRGRDPLRVAFPGQWVVLSDWRAGLQVKGGGGPGWPRGQRGIAGLRERWGQSRRGAAGSGVEVRKEAEQRKAPFWVSRWPAGGRQGSTQWGPEGWLGKVKKSVWGAGEGRWEGRMLRTELQAMGQNARSSSLGTSLSLPINGRPHSPSTSSQIPQNPFSLSMTSPR